MTNQKKMLVAGCVVAVGVIGLTVWLRPAKSIPLSLDAKSGTPTMRLGGLTVVFAEAKLSQPLPDVLVDTKLAVLLGGVGGDSSSGGEGFVSSGDTNIRFHHEFKQTAGEGSLTISFKESIQKTHVFELIDEGATARYLGQEYSLTNNRTLVIGSEGAKIDMHDDRQIKERARR